MGVPVLIIGKSGSGKSTSLRNFSKNEIGVINVLGKPLPFKNDIPDIKTDDYEKIEKTILKSIVKSIVIDDAGYLMTNQFMRGHSNTGSGNAIFSFYNTIGDKFWGLIRFVVDFLPPEKIVYFMMHEDKNDFGDIKPKTIGKMLDEKACIEGMFTVALRCKDHKFLTQTTENDIAKSPMGMFDTIEIDNDLKFVDEKIREYWNLNSKNEKQEDK